MNELAVIQKVHHYLQTAVIEQQQISRLYTDAHHTLLPDSALKPFQRFSLDLGDMIVHPDLVGQLADGETLLAVEAKGSDNLLTGLAQAELYQQGFHITFLAAAASAWTTTLTDWGQKKNVSLLSVHDTVTCLHWPQPQMPRRDPYQFITRQLDTVIQVTAGQTFTFNMPTHYLVWAIVLEAGTRYPLSNLPPLLADYPAPKDWRRALSGAQKLGLVSIEGDIARLTPTGQAAKDILPASLEMWANIHRTIATRTGPTSPTLHQCHPASAAILRLLLLQDPLVRLLITGLRQFPDLTANFFQLAQICDALDHARTPIFFLKPESVAAYTDEKGRIAWLHLPGDAFRSTSFYQYKSILKHAGIVKPTSLGGSSSQTYDPQRDIWALTGNAA
jgi:hypothetical protein